MADAISRSGVAIRLTDERWRHIAEEHAELAGLREDVLRTVTEAEAVYAGPSGENLALRFVEPGKAMIVVYREEMDQADGFIITAFLTRKLAAFEKRSRVWPRE